MKIRISLHHALLALLGMLVLLLLSPGVRFSFSPNAVEVWDDENTSSKEDQNLISDSFSTRKAGLGNIAGLIVEMPNKNYVASYLASLSWSSKIQIQTYELTEKRVKSRIEQQALQGTHFQIMLENKKYQQFQNTFKKLQNERSGYQNIELISDEHLPTQYLHSKITLADSGFRIQSSNLTHSTFAKNREHLFRSQNPQVLESLQLLFAKDFTGQRLTASDLHPNLVVCNINCREVITKMLAWALRSITIQTQYLTDPKLFDLIAERSQDLTFRAIFSATENNESLPEYFGTHQVRLLKKPYVHTKMILIDDELLLLGSMNLSANSLDNNREIWILLTDPALIAQFKKGFERDWKLSNVGG